MQNHFAQAVLCLVARDEPSNDYCATDRYTVSNGLVLVSADYHGHLAPRLPVKTGFLLH
ncbi:hypothetical protein CSC17_2504 [Klebsiella oxytoca]|nr:hypothetical protein CSC17_2504 [Klebsiella oxytoca]EUC87731.1 hypothetical protein HMPREF1570_2393 [Klebsiella oxytoca KA-2]EUC93247.1 hypothetical protein HMPREF1569_5359 [Klebsiella oxytoca OK-1]